MTPEAALARARHHRDHDWDPTLVCAAIEAAWCARPRTIEHTQIMLWPTLYIIGNQNRFKLGELRLAVHLWGLHSSDPAAYPWTRRNGEGLLSRTRDHRTGEPWSYGRLKRTHEKACRMISVALNSRIEPVGLVISEALLAVSAANVT